MPRSVILRLIALPSASGPRPSRDTTVVVYRFGFLVAEMRGRGSGNADRHRPARPVAVAVAGRDGADQQLVMNQTGPQSPLLSLEYAGGVTYTGWWRLFLMTAWRLLVWLLIQEPPLFQPSGIS